MPSNRAPDAHEQSKSHARPPQPSQKRAPEVEPDPAGQSPEAPIEFAADNDVARGNEERANAEPEPAALHHAEVPGQPDPAVERRHEAAKHHD
jgi:hypothetical protein